MERHQWEVGRQGGASRRLLDSDQWTETRKLLPRSLQRALGGEVRGGQKFGGFFVLPFCCCNLGTRRLLAGQSPLDVASLRFLTSLCPQWHFDYLFIIVVVVCFPSYFFLSYQRSSCLLIRLLHLIDSCSLFIHPRDFSHYVPTFRQRNWSRVRFSSRIYIWKRNCRRITKCRPACHRLHLVQPSSFLKSSEIRYDLFSIVRLSSAAAARKFRPRWSSSSPRCRRNSSPSVSCNIKHDCVRAAGGKKSLNFQSSLNVIQVLIRWLEECLVSIPSISRRVKCQGIIDSAATKMLTRDDAGNFSLILRLAFRNSLEK